MGFVPRTILALSVAALTVLAACTQPATESIASCREAAESAADVAVRVATQVQDAAAGIVAAVPQNGGLTPDGVLDLVADHSGDLNGVHLQVEKIKDAFDKHGCEQDPTTPRLLADEFERAADSLNNEQYSRAALRKLADALRVARNGS